MLLKNNRALSNVAVYSLLILQCGAISSLAATTGDAKADTAKEVQSQSPEDLGTQEDSGTKSVPANEPASSDMPSEDSSQALTLEDIPDKLREALICNKRGDHKGCIAICDQILLLDKDNVAALSHRGRSLISSKKYKEGVDDLTRVIDSTGGSHQVRGARALGYLQLEQYDKVIDDCTQAIKLNAKNQEYFIVRSVAYHRLKDEQKSLDDLNKGLSLDPEGPNQAIFLLARADVYSALNRDDDCLKDLNKIIKLRPKDPQSYMNRANYYMKEQNWTKVVQDLDSVIDFALMGPLSNQALILRAEAQRKCANYSEAASDYTSLLAGYPKDIDYLYGRADSRFNLKQYDLALKDINKALDENKNSSEANSESGSKLTAKFLDLRAKIYDALNQPDKARLDRSQLPLIK